MSYRIKIVQKEERTDYVYSDNDRYDNVEKLAEKIAQEQIDALCQELGVERKDLFFDFDASCYRLKIFYKDNFTRVERIIALGEIIYKKDKK